MISRLLFVAAFAIGDVFSLCPPIRTYGADFVTLQGVSLNFHTMPSQPTGQILNMYCFGTERAGQFQCTAGGTWVPEPLGCCRVGRELPFGNNFLSYLIIFDL